MHGVMKAYLINRVNGGRLHFLNTRPSLKNRAKNKYTTPTWLPHDKEVTC